MKIENIPNNLNTSISECKNIQETSCIVERKIKEVLDMPLSKMSDDSRIPEMIELMEHVKCESIKIEGNMWSILEMSKKKKKRDQIRNSEKITRVSQIALGVWKCYGVEVTVSSESDTVESRKLDKMVLIPKNMRGLDAVAEIALDYGRNPDVHISRSRLDLIRDDLIIGSSGFGGEISRMVRENKGPGDITDAALYYEFVCLSVKSYIKDFSDRLWKDNRKVYDLCKDIELPVVFCKNTYGTSKNPFNVQKILKRMEDWNEESFDDLMFINPRKIIRKINDENLMDRIFI